MNNSSNTPFSQGKDNQINIVYKVFQTGTPKTMLQVSKETGIERANICRYVAEFRKQDNIQVVRKGICSISKHRAGYYTTNKDLFKKNNQLSLFSDES
ncbi:MAG: hypothetical protein GXO80_10210 [Chlorobi bacterium]|nr:hypothetical protein [Chlorobiota bacterium]